MVAIYRQCSVVTSAWCSVCRVFINTPSGLELTAYWTPHTWAGSPGGGETPCSTYWPETARDSGWWRNGHNVRVDAYITHNRCGLSGKYTCALSAACAWHTGPPGHRDTGLAILLVDNVLMSDRIVRSARHIGVTLVEGGCSRLRPLGWVCTAAFAALCAEDTLVTVGPLSRPSLSPAIQPRISLSSSSLKSKPGIAKTSCGLCSRKSREWAPLYMRGPPSWGPWEVSPTSWVVHQNT